ncbi:unnamed protein product [Mytilus coruscus]|uniref:TRIM2_3 n=1 Tax=Mytilus coruscus TaxID=42192 RepID=A0A6J8AL03_MYTCO|nr:unnamed protein product [Mytilus coruscus]
MASAIKAAKEELICHICKNNLNDPKTLLCLHSFCKNCIQGFIVENVRNIKKPKGFECPTCRRETSVMKFIGKSPVDWADELHTNESLVNILKLLTLSDDQTSKQCPFHMSKEVEFFCEQHLTLACSLCANITHKSCESVLPLSEAISKRRTSSSKIISGLSEQITMTEKVMNNRHVQLETIEKTEMDIKNQLGEMRQRFMDFFGQMEGRILDKIAQARMKEGGVLQTEIDICHGLLNEIEDSMKTVQEALEFADEIKFLIQYNDHLKRYNERQQRLKAMAESLRDIRISFQANREVEHYLFQIKSVGTLNIDRTRSKIAGLGQTHHELLGTSNQDFMYDFINVPKTARSTVDIAFVRPNTHRPTTYNPNSTTSLPSIRSISEKGDVTSRTSRMSYVEIKSQRDPPQVDYETEQPGVSIAYKSSKTIKATLKTELDVAVAFQKECSIEGAAFLKSGYIVLSDSSNSSLKLLNSKYQFLTMTKFASNPGDITTVGEFDVVVCLPDTMRLKHQKIENERIYSGEVLSVSDKCYSVSFNKGTLATCSSKSIYVFQRDHNAWLKTTTIPVRSESLMYIAVDPSGEKIVVTRNGHPNTSIICMTIRGTKIWNFSHESVKLPRGVVFYGNKILVAAWDQHKILQISSDGRLEGVVVNQGIQWPWKISLNHRGDKMIVSQCYYRLPTKEKNCLKIFKLSKPEPKEIVTDRTIEE